MARRAGGQGNRIRQGRVFRCGLLISFAAVVLLAPTALATSAPRVSLKLPGAVDAGSPIPFSWSGRHLGPQHRLVVQRQVGTAHSWQTVMRLKANSGSDQLPGLPLGRYKLRIADFSIIRRVLAQQVARIGVFGLVPFSTLFNASENRVYTTPSTTFSYVAHYESFDDPAWTVSHNHCRSVHIAFVSGSHYKPTTSTLTLVQETRDPVSVSTPTDAIATLDAELVPGQSWSVNPDTIGGESTFYINGYAVCESTAGFFE
jgi:hypothetical protein